MPSRICGERLNQGRLSGHNEDNVVHNLHETVLPLRGQGMHDVQ
jgi:hypothetical protein